MKASAERHGVTVWVELINSRVDRKDHMGARTAWGREGCRGHTPRSPCTRLTGARRSTRLVLSRNSANGPDISFSGPETITGGTGRFAGATASTLVTGTASFATMTGQFTSVGSISY